MSLWRKRGASDTNRDTIAPNVHYNGQNQPKWFNMTALANNDLSIKSDDLSIKSEEAMCEVQRLGQEIEKNEILEQNNQRIETLYALYQQASSHRDILMAQQKEMILKIRDANEIIFKSCVNLPHWKRTAMRYLKHNVPQAHQQAVNEFNEHPDGRGQA